MGQEYIYPADKMAKILQSVFTKIVENAAATGEIQIETITNVELQVIPQEDFPLHAVGESTRRFGEGIGFYELTLTIAKPEDKITDDSLGLHDFIGMASASNSRFPQLISQFTSSLAPGQSGKMSCVLVIKDNDYLPELCEIERVNLSRLDKLGLKSVCCVYPPNPSYIRNLNLSDVEAVMSVLEPDLVPVSFFNEEQLFSTEAGPSIFERLISYLAQMHRNLLTHGDAHLKNWGYQHGEIYGLDLEGGVDFNQALQGPNSANNAKGFFDLYGLSFRKFGFPPQVEFIEQIFQTAVREDFERLAESIPNRYELSETSITNIYNALESYLGAVKGEPMLSGVESLLQEIFQF